MRKRRARVCVLVSGGLDSAVLLHQLLHEGNGVVPLYLRCGFYWEATELYWLRRFLRAVRSTGLTALQIVDVPLRSVYGAHWSFTGRGIPGARSADRAVYLPGRNVLLLSYAAIVCARRRVPTIAVGTLNGNPFGDASPGFFARLAQGLTQTLDHPIRILAPLRRFSKAQVIRQAVGAPLQFTFSCLRPKGRRHCGRCNKCAERRRAFRGAGVPDPTRYAR